MRNPPSDPAPLYYMVFFITDVTILQMLRILASHVRSSCVIFFLLDKGRVSSPARTGITYSSAIDIISRTIMTFLVVQGAPATW